MCLDTDVLSTDKCFLEVVDARSIVGTAPGLVSIRLPFRTKKLCSEISLKAIWSEVLREHDRILRYYRILSRNLVATSCANKDL